MATISILILAVSLDALSFGLAQGIKKNSINPFYALCMTIVSTILFAVPLYLSSIVIKYLDENICCYINGSVLIGLGVLYIITFIVNSFKKEELKATPKTNLSLGYCLISTLPISLDAIFTGFLSGYTLSYIAYGIVFYFIVTFLAIYIPNKIALKMSGKNNLKIEWLSGTIFIILGLLKLFGI